MTVKLLSELGVMMSLLHQGIFKMQKKSLCILYNIGKINYDILIQIVWLWRLAWIKNVGAECLGMFE